MKIKEKLFLAFGFYILLVVMGGAFAYNELRAITKRLILVAKDNSKYSGTVAAFFMI
jgi:hypothetical protein